MFAYFLFFLEYRKTLCPQLGIWQWTRTGNCWLCTKDLSIECGQPRFVRGPGSIFEGTAKSKVTPRVGHVSGRADAVSQHRSGNATHPITLNSTWRKCSSTQTQTQFEVFWKTIIHSHLVIKLCFYFCSRIDWKPYALTNIFLGNVSSHTHTYTHFLSLPPTVTLTLFTDEYNILVSAMGLFFHYFKTFVLCLWISQCHNRPNRRRIHPFVG